MSRPEDDEWTLWGPVYDKQATIGVVRELQAKGRRVRVVRDGNHNNVYFIDDSVQPEPDPAA